MTSTDPDRQRGRGRPPTELTLNPEGAGVPVPPEADAPDLAEAVIEAVDGLVRERIRTLSLTPGVVR